MGRRISHSEQRWEELESQQSIIRRCSASTQSGTRCKRVALAGSITCDRHTSHLAEVQRLTREEWVALAPAAFREVARILSDPGASDAAKLKAVDLVNRATGMEEAKKVVVDVQHDPVQVLLKQLLDDPDGLAAPPPEPLAVESPNVVMGEIESPTAADEVQVREPFVLPDLTNVVNLNPHVPPPYPGGYAPDDPDGCA